MALFLSGKTVVCLRKEALRKETPAKDIVL